MKKITASALALILAASFLLTVGCGAGDGNKNNAKTTDIVADGATGYVIVRDGGSGSEEKALITDLRNDIRMATTVTIEIAANNETLPEGKNRFVIGTTDMPETADAAAGLEENRFRFLMKDGTLTVVATNTKCLKLALDTFRSEYVTESGISVPENLDRSWQCDMEITTREVTNPINDEGDDPDVVEHDGVYYYCWSAGNGVMVSKANSLDKISKNGGAKVYTAPSGTMYGGEYWAPELHYINGEWYIYVAADDGNDANHRMYVLKGTKQDPTRPFEMVGKISDPSDKWAIDGTVLTIGDEMYFVWSGWAGDNDFGNQRIYIAHMSDPTTIDSKRVQLSAHENGWEGGVNEGPYGVNINGDIYIIYAANGSWDDDYCLAYLKLTGNDPLSARSWTKSSSPILSKSSTAYGPGHASVVKLEDGSYWLVYHANLESHTGWSGRSVWIQPLSFKSNGDIKVQNPKKKVNFPTVKWVVTGEIE